MKKLTEFLKVRPWITIAGTLIIGLLLGWLLFGGNDAKTEQLAQDHTASDHVVGTKWTCSMHPQIRQDAPGNCPICGMELIPLVENKEDEGFDPDAVILSASAAKIAEVESSVITREVPKKTVLLPGMVMADERRIQELTAHFPGRIDELFVNFTGQKVRKGQVLAKVFSAELVTAQKELFEAIKYKESNPQFYQAARNKFKLWLFTDEQINSIEESGEVEFQFDIVSPGTGTVTKRNIALGDHVMEGMSMFQIIDLSHLWVEFDAYETDIPWINMRSVAEITINSVPGKVFRSKVTFIDPVLNVKTRTTRIRTELDNRNGLLRPGMFAQAKINSTLANGGRLLVPKSAVLWTGKKSVVYVRMDHQDAAAYHYREVTLGEDTGTHYVVLAGLNEGEAVATNGVFKIDAAAQLKGTRSMMNPSGGKQSMGGMAGMDMGGDKKKTPVKTAENSADIDKAFNGQLMTVLHEYLKIKDALVASSATDATSATKATLAAIENVNMELLKGDAHMAWMKQMKEIKAPMKIIIEATDLEQQRLAFADLSEALHTSLVYFHLSGMPVYYQYCPMARDNKGAYWLSISEEIKNPYLGDAMLTCGETKETIK